MGHFSEFGLNKFESGPEILHFYKVPSETTAVAPGISRFEPLLESNTSQN